MARSTGRDRGSYSERPLTGARIAVQEYGVSNTELLEALRAQGAHVVAVPVYRWDLPEDLSALRSATDALSRGSVDVVLFTTGIQVRHLWRVADQAGLQDAVRLGLHGTVVASIGPMTSEELERCGVPRDIEASHPKIGVLVREAAERSREILRAKRA